MYRESLARLVDSYDNMSVIPDGAKIVPGGSVQLSGEPDILLVVIEGVSKSGWNAVEKIKFSSEIKVVSVAFGSPVPDEPKTLSDMVVQSAEGSQGLERAIRQAMTQERKMIGLRIAEGLGLYGRARPLTAREFSVAKLLAEGMRNRNIARELNLKEQSIKNVVSTIMRKLGCENRTQVALRLARLQMSSEADRQGDEPEAENE